MKLWKKISRKVWHLTKKMVEYCNTRLPKNAMSLKTRYGHSEHSSVINKNHSMTDYSWPWKSMNPVTSFSTDIVKAHLHDMRCAEVTEMDESSALEQEELGLSTSDSNYNEKQTNTVTWLSFRRKRKFKTKHVIPLSYLWMGDYVDIVGRDRSSACKSILLSWPMGNFVATFR